MRPFIACSFVVAFLSGVASAGPEDTLKWESFKAKHGKQHPAHEDAERMQRFLQRDAEIEEHNARYAAGLESFSRQHSQYSDLSDEEVRQVAFGFDPIFEETNVPSVSWNRMSSPPDQWDWRDKGGVTPAKNQLQCGSCYAFTSAAVVESLLLRKTGKEYDLSEQDIIDCSFMKFRGGRQNKGCNGGWPEAVFDYLNEKDLVDENDYPYESGPVNRHFDCRKPDRVNRVLNGTLTYTRKRLDNEDDVRALLVEKGPLLMGIGVDGANQQKFIDLGQGIFDVESTSTVQPNHLVVLVGYGTDGNKPYWVIKNSWGPTWADAGFGKILRGKNICNLMKPGFWYVEHPDL